MQLFRVVCETSIQRKRDKADTVRYGKTTARKEREKKKKYEDTNKQNKEERRKKKKY